MYSPALSFLSDYKNLLNSPTRIKIIKYLGSNEDVTITEISKYLDISFRWTQPHINTLIGLNLVKKRKEGKYARLNLTKLGKQFPKLLKGFSP